MGQQRFTSREHYSDSILAGRHPQARIEGAQESLLAERVEIGNRIFQGKAAGTVWHMPLGRIRHWGIICHSSVFVLHIRHWGVFILRGGLRVLRRGLGVRGCSGAGNDRRLRQSLAPRVRQVRRTRIGRLQLWKKEEGFREALGGRGKHETKITLTL